MPSFLFFWICRASLEVAIGAMLFFFSRLDPGFFPKHVP